MLQYFGPILTYGALGLASILAYLTYRLLHQESQREKPKESILRAANRFMYGTLVLAVICGLLAILDTFVKNSTDWGTRDKERTITELQKQVDSLTKQNEEYASRLKEAGDYQAKSVRLAALDQQVAQLEGKNKSLGEELALARSDLTRIKSAAKPILDIREGLIEALPDNNLMKAPLNPVGIVPKGTPNQALHLTVAALPVIPVPPAPAAAAGELWRSAAQARHPVPGPLVVRRVHCRLSFRSFASTGDG